MHALGLPEAIDDVLAAQAPGWAVEAFTVVNAFIALSYGLLAFYFIRRIKLPRGKDRNPLTVIAMVGAVFFFVGCAHTHLDLALWSAEDKLIDHWYTWVNLISHFLQGAGGLTFWVLATFFLQLNIFDKRHYERTLEQATAKYDETNHPGRRKTDRQGGIDSDTRSDKSSQKDS